MQYFNGMLDKILILALCKKNITVKVCKIRSPSPNWGFSEGREKISEGRNDRQREVMV